MKNSVKKLPVYFLTCLLFCAALLAPIGGGKASAATNETKFDETNVLDDLKSIDGFSLLRYPFYESIEPKMGVIEFVEYCYDYRANMRDNYGLYLYVYNPNGQNIVVNSVKNKVQLAVAYDSYPITEESEATDYEKFDLRFCSMSEGAGVNKLFYKFKIIDHKSADGKTIAERVNSMDRRYDISGIELLTEGNPNATEYGVATSYHFTGFAEGYGEGGAGTTLARNTIETISLDLHSTTYRFPYINQNGPGHQNQLDSVYFAVPKEFNENYGDLYRVKCCWDEQKTTPVIVTKNEKIYSWASKWVGQRENITDMFGIFDEMGSGIGQGAYSANWGWGYDYRDYQTPLICDIVNVFNDTPAGYIFKSDKSNVKDTEITSTEMKKWIYSHDKADYLFLDSVDAGRTKGYQEHTFTADEPFDMLTFNQSASGWDKFLVGWQQFWTGKSWDFGPEQQDPVEPIRLVKDEDFTGTDAADAENLYVHKDDFAEFQKFYDANKSANNVFLLRFAVTDYYSNMQTVLTDPEWYEVWDWKTGHQDKSSTYMAQETVFLDFDIIELTFLRDTTETIIPVVATPIDIVGSISAPIVKNNTPPWVWIVLALLLILLIVVLVLFFPVLRPIFTAVVKVLWWIVTAPFRFIAWLIKKIHAAVKKRKEAKAAAPPKAPEPPDPDPPKSSKSKKASEEAVKTDATPTEQHIILEIRRQPKAPQAKSKGGKNEKSNHKTK